MNISSSARKQKRGAATASGESAVVPPITLCERSSTGLALLRIFVGYLWFQQLFWKLPPTFAGLYGYIVRESQHAILPGYGTLLQQAFLAGCPSLSSPAACVAFVPLAACVWAAELLVAINLLFGLFTRFGAILATVLAVQLYVGLAYTEWIWTYGMLVLLALVLVAVPAGPRLGVDLLLGAHRELVCVEKGGDDAHTPQGAPGWGFGEPGAGHVRFREGGAPGNGLLPVLRWFGITIADSTLSRLSGYLLLIVLGGAFGLIFELELTNITNHASSLFSLSFGQFLSSFPLAVLFGVLIGAISIQWQGQHG